MATKLPHLIFAVLASDVAVFTIREGTLQVLLIQMKKKPFSGMWAVPGGLVQPKEDVDAAAKRLLFEKSGIKNVYLEQLYTFGRVNRDPFGRVVSVAYIALIPSQGLGLTTSKDHSDIRWFPINALPKLAYDHSEVVATALRRLRAKLTYTNIVYSLLPREFTLTDLQTTYEIILGKKLDKRNFRKKVLGVHLVKPTQKKQQGIANRPALLYSFTATSPKIVEIL